MTRYTVDQERAARRTGAALRTVVAGLRAFAQAAQEGAAQIGGDTAVRLLALADAARGQADGYAASQCESCDELAVWQHPDGDWYCMRHDQGFDRCGVCGQFMPLQDMVGDPAGHESCHGPDEDDGR